MGVTEIRLRFVRNLCLLLCLLRRINSTCVTHLQAKPSGLSTSDDPGSLDYVTMCTGLTKNVPINVLNETTVLKLSGNDFEYVHEDLFRRYDRLEQLDVSSNRIVSISVFAFQQNVQLVSLNLSINPLRELTKGVFNSSSNLRVLDLSFNQLTSIDRLSFAPLVALESLNLTNNRITNIAPDAFRLNLRLTSLFLANNALVTLSEQMERYLPPSLNKWSLAYNPWYCDCRLLWLKSLLQRSEADFDRAELRCKSGSATQALGELWVTLRYNTFACAPVLHYPSNDVAVNFTHPEGSTIVLTCRTHSLLRTNVVWYKDWVANWTAADDPLVIVGGDRPGSSNASNFPAGKPKFAAWKGSEGNLTTTFTIARLEPADAGVYSCLLGNEAGYVIGNYTVNVGSATTHTVAFAPVIAEGQLQMITVVAGFFGLSFIVLSILACSAYFRKERSRGLKRHAVPSKADPKLKVKVKAKGAKTNGSTPTLRYNEVEQQLLDENPDDPALNTGTGPRQLVFTSARGSELLPKKDSPFASIQYRYSASSTLSDAGRLLAGFTRSADIDESARVYSPNTMRAQSQSLSQSQSQAQSQQARTVTFRIDVDENCPLHGQAAARHDESIRDRDRDTLQDCEWHDSDENFCPIHSPANGNGSGTPNVEQKFGGVRNGFGSTGPPYQTFSNTA